MTDDARTTTVAAVAGLPASEGCLPSLEAIRIAESIAAVRGEAADWSDEFIFNIIRDIANSRVRRRAALSDPTMTPLSHREEIDRRLKLYDETGNRDYLIDAGKFSMWAWIGAAECK